MCVKVLETCYFKHVTIDVLLINILDTDVKNIIENRTTYILKWKGAIRELFNYLNFGKKPFVSRHCSF